MGLGGALGLSLLEARRIFPVQAEPVKVMKEMAAWRRMGLLCLPFAQGHVALQQGGADPRQVSKQTQAFAFSGRLGAGVCFRGLLADLECLDFARAHAWCHVWVLLHHRSCSAGDALSDLQGQAHAEHPDRCICVSAFTKSRYVYACFHCHARAT